jgi:hypothetical protein
MIFDSCFNTLCDKDDYLGVFFANVYACVYAKDIKDLFIKSVKEHKYVESKNTILKIILRERYEEYIKRKAKGVIIPATKDVTEPFYRIGAGYIVDLENERIRKHYYHPDC